MSGLYECVVPDCSNFTMGIYCSKHKEKIIALGEKGMHRAILGVYASPILDLVQKYVEYVIGEDEPGYFFRPELRKEQRKRAGIGGR